MEIHSHNVFSRNIFRFLEKEIKKDEIPMMDAGDSPEAPQPREMIDLEATFEKLEHELQEVRNLFVTSNEMWCTFTSNFRSTKMLKL